MSNQNGVLYVVATPIGNLGDISERARSVLAKVDLIAAEDTRHTAKLLNHLGIHTSLTSLHEHNERQKLAPILARLQDGQQIALVSDAGTPLISDPGYVLVKAAIEAEMSVVPVPGPSALTAALSVSGVATDSFLFVGFLPAKQGPRRTLLASLSQQTSTLVFYLSVHRLSQDLETIGETLGWNRGCCLAREMTKKFEQFYRGDVKSVLAAIASDANSSKGELVLVVEGAQSEPDDQDTAVNIDELLAALIEQASPAHAVKIAKRLTGLRKNFLYERAQAIVAKSKSSNG